MPLSKLYTKKTVRNTLILWVGQLNILKLDPDLVNDFIDLAVLDVYEQLSDAIFKGYGRTAIINDDSSSFNATSVPGDSFTDSTKTITRVAHGLTAADIGKRIIFGSIFTATNIITSITVSTIVSIVDVDNFTVFNSPGTDIYVPGTSTLFYALLSVHATAQADLSSLKINRIRKLVDATNGECIEVKDARDFENLGDFPQKQNKVRYYVNGELMQLYLGTNLTAFGTLTLHYFGYPEKPATEDDYLDIKDQYISLVMQKAQNYIIGHLTNKPENAFAGPVESKSNQVRKTNLSEQEILSNKR